MQLAIPLVPYYRVAAINIKRLLETAVPGRWESGGGPPAPDGVLLECLYRRPPAVGR